MMSTDETLWWQHNQHNQHAQTPQELEAPAEPERRHWGRKRKLVTSAAVAAGVALTGGVAIAASSNNGSSSTPAQVGQFGGGPGATNQNQAPDGGQNGTTQNQIPGGFSGGAPPGVGQGTTLHGEYVIETSTGTYATRVTQQGTVTAVSASELTLKSDDGFSKTYAVPSTVSVRSIKSGATVNLTASVSGETATVINVR